MVSSSSEGARIVNLGCVDRESCRQGHCFRGHKSLAAIYGVAAARLRGPGSSSTSSGDSSSVPLCCSASLGFFAAG
eukprot:682771-Pleurochrysis_carterae.AAC.3